MRNLARIAVLALLWAAGPALAQVPISGLSAASTPLGGTELVPLVQGGVTKNAPITAVRGPNPGAVNGAVKSNGSSVFTQAACADLTNAAASCSTDTTNASNISSGTIPAARLPLATTGAFGAVKPDGSTITISAGVITAVTGGGGTVTTTGSPASGNLSFFSGATSITNGNLTGDVTTSGGAATTLATVNSNVGTFGDATHCANFTVNGKGLITAAAQSTSCPGGGGGGTPGGSNTQLQYNNSGSFGGISGATSNGTSVTLTSPTLVTPALGTPASGVLTNATGLPISGIAGLGTGVGTALGTNVGSAGSPVVNGGALGTPSSGVLTHATGLPLTSGVSGTLPVANGGTGITFFGTGVASALGVNVSGSGGICLTTGSACGGGSGTVTSVATGACLTGGPITTTGTVAATYTIRSVSGTTDTIVSGDACKLVIYTNAGTKAVTVPQAIGSFGTGFSFDVQNPGAGAATLTPGGGSLVNGSATLVVAQNTGCTLVSDGTNWQVSQCTALGSGSGTVTSITCNGGLTGGVITTSGTCAADTGTSGHKLPYLDGTNVWGALQTNCQTTLTISTTTFTPDGSCNDYKLTLTGSDTIANPSATPVVATYGSFIICQDGMGSRTATWGSQYVTPSGVASITLSTSASVCDTISYRVIDATHILLVTAALNPTH